MTVYLGTQGWSYKDWVGTFYPPGTKASEYLAYYCQVFDAVELDTTFYGIPTESRVDAWRDATPVDFRFTAKMPRSITHDSHLVGTQDQVTEFLSVMRRLGERLGAVLIQMPPDFKYDEYSALQVFLRSLPTDIRFAAEFRHRSWLRQETYDLLHQNGVAWTMIDLRYMPVTPELTADFTYARLLGDHRLDMQMNATQIDRRVDLEHWAETLDTVARKIERAYAFVNNHYSGHSPADVRFLRYGLGLPEKSVTDGGLTQGSLL